MIPGCCSVLLLPRSISCALVKRLLLFRRSCRKTAAVCWLKLLQLTICLWGLFSSPSAVVVNKSGNPLRCQRVRRRHRLLRLKTSLRNFVFVLATPSQRMSQRKHSRARDGGRLHDTIIGVIWGSFLDRQSQ